MTQAEKLPDEIEVGVTYAGAAKPFQGDYNPVTGMSQVKAEVLDAFGLAETTDSAGNQTTYTFRKGKERVDLSATVGDAADGHKHLQMKLVREVIAG